MTNIKYVKKTYLILREVKELIKVLDTIKVKIDYTRKIFNSDINIIDLEVRNVFSIVVSVLILK